MACRSLRSRRQRAATASVVVALLACGIASAQTDTAASAPSAEPDPHEAAPGEPAPNEAAPNEAAPSDPAPSDPAAKLAAPSEAAAGGAAPADFPKALTPQQRAPENLQGWLRERNRRRPALAERPPPVPPAPLALPAPERDVPESAAAGYKRRLLSFDEGGVTVLSNRHAPPPLARVQAAAAIAVPAPTPTPSEQDGEDSSLTETRSLRAKQPKARRMPSEHGLGWPLFAVPVAAISLTLLWLRKRRISG